MTTTVGDRARDVHLSAVRSGYVLFDYVHSRAWLARWVMYVVHSLCFNYIQLYIVDCWLYIANRV